LEQKTRRLFIIKNLIYTLMLLTAYVLQETPALLEINGVRPMLVAAVIVSIAMLEGEFSGGLYGLFGGILCDTAAFHIFGVASIFFLIFGCACGLLIIYLVQPNRRTAFLLSFLFSLFYGGIAHYLIYGMWGYDGAAMLLLTRTLPCAVYTGAAGLVIFTLAGKLDQKLAEEGNKLR